MKEIIISNNKKIISDSRQYIYCEKLTVKKGKTKGREKWVHKWFYPSLVSCYNDLLEVFTRSEYKDTLKANIEASASLLENLKREIIKVGISKITK